jgi:hypothetical protein
MWLVLLALAAGGDPADDALAVPPFLSLPETGAPDPSRLEQILRLDDQAQAGDRPAPELEGPHDSFGGYFDTHFSSQAWKEYVWYDYLTQPAVLIPLGIGVAAAIISHWDKTLEKHLRNSLTGTQTLGNVTLYTLIGGSLLSG